MSYIGDFALEKTFDTKFTTVNTSGVPTTLAGVPVISAYVDNSLVQITAGITLTVDFDGVVGLHNVRVVATAANGYAADSNYQLVITTGTVDGSSVVGYVVAEFSLEARSALRPTTADRTLDIAATGEAGLDLDNTVGTLTAAEIPNLDAAITTRLAPTVAGRTLDVAAGGEAGLDLDNTVGTLSAAEIPNLDAAISTRAIAGDAMALTAAAINLIWDELTAEARVAGSYGQLFKDNIDAALSTLATAAALATVQADTDDIQTRLPAALVGGRMDSSVGAMVAGVITAAVVATGAIDADALATDAGQEIADRVLSRSLATGADGGRTVQDALRILRNLRTIAGGTLTVMQEDDATAAWTAAVTTAAGDPITEIDPA